MIFTIISSASPLILAALGGLLSERAGILNIALEGMILGGAFAALIVTGISGSLGAGILAAILFGILTGLIFNLSTFSLKGNPFISGLGINILIPALIASISLGLYGNQGIIRPSAMPELPSYGGLDLFDGISLTYIILFMYIFYRTRPGLMLRACGEEPGLLKSRGINPLKVQKWAVIASSVSASLAGAALSLRLEVFVPGMSAGKGWIALVAIYLGYKNIPGISIACILFALAEWGTNRAQGLLNFPPSLILSFPYFLTMAFLLLFSIRKKQ